MGSDSVAPHFVIVRDIPPFYVQVTGESFDCFIKLSPVQNLFVPVASVGKGRSCLAT